MNTFQLSCFLAVAEYLNFSQAAQQLHVTHPAVSQQIQSLEKELNVKLFQRTTRSVKLTEEGKAFLNDARQIVAISDRAKKRFDSTMPGTLEVLSLGFYNFPCMFLLSDALEQLHAERPQLHPRLQVIPFQHIYRMLEEGDLDAVVGVQGIAFGQDLRALQGDRPGAAGMPLLQPQSAGSAYRSLPQRPPGGTPGPVPAAENLLPLHRSDPESAHGRPLPC